MLWLEQISGIPITFDTVETRRLIDVLRLVL